MERIQFDKDVKPISEFRANAPSLIEQVPRTKRPLVITQHGKSAAILLDVQEYEAILEKLDSPKAAERWAEKIIQKVESLSEFPKSGRKVPELNKKEYRGLILGNPLMK